MHLNGKFFEKLIFLILWKQKSLFSLDILNIVSINKFQRSRLTFDLSAKVAHIGVQSTYKIIVFSGTTLQIEIKFQMTTPYDWLAKRGMCIKRLFWPPMRSKNKSCSLQVSSH